jgi:hypothetical protein
MASIDYYNDSSQWGSYQYITLDEIINNFAMSRDVDDFTSNTPRHKILYQAMRGLREFYYDILQEVRAIELELSPALTITLPPDFVSLVRISWKDEYGQLHPMASDKRMSIASEYLQANDYSLLFDNAGNVLEGYTKPTATNTVIDPDGDQLNNYVFCNGGFAPNADMSNVYPNGKYILNKSKGVISFGSGVEGKDIVLEYISDGLYTGGTEGTTEDGIRVNKFAESAIIDFIYYQLTKNRRHVPYNEKMRARKEYHNSRRIAKTRINSLKKDDLLQVFKGASKWIK